jgi:two-component system sensor histidine kinase QseC
MRRLPRSLQGRLLVLVLGTVVTVWLAAAVGTWLDASHELDELLDGHLAQAAALLVVQQASEVGDDDHRVDAPTLHRYAPKVAFQVWHEGRLSVRSSNAPAQPMVPSDQRLEGGFTTVQLEGKAWRVFVTDGAERDVRVYVGEQLESRAAILWALLRATLTPMAVALPLLTLAAWWAVRRGVAPMRKLGRALAGRDPRTLQPVEVAGAPSEMVPMLDALNSLFGRIGSLMESERRFTSDAAHELRTPIAAVRTQAQVALAEADADLRRHALQSTLEGCDRAARLVDQLLTLSRVEAGSTPVKASLDLSALARSVAAEVAPWALEKQQSFELEASQGCPVLAEETLMRVLLRNLLDNAVRYSPPYARVRVQVRPEEGGVLLRVEDSGPGLADADAQRLGERFFRVLGSGQSGSGLGWSIVRRIAAVHGAKVHVGRSAELGGLAVDLLWSAKG